MQLAPEGSVAVHGCGHSSPAKARCDYSLRGTVEESPSLLNSKLSCAQAALQWSP